MALKLHGSCGALICIVLLASTVRSLPGRFPRKAKPEPISAPEHHPPMDYRFRYEVKDEPTTNFQNRIEISKDGIVKGSYSLLSPDGILRTTVYSDKGEGYKVTLHEEPTDILVVGSGLPGDPSRSYGEGSSHTNQEKSRQAFQRLGGYPFDFEDLSEVSSVEISKEKGTSIYRKLKPKTKSRYQIRDSEEDEDTSIFVASSSPHSPELTPSLKESSQPSTPLVFDSPSSKTEKEIPTIPIDQETFGSLGQDELVAVIQDMIKDKTEREKKIKDEVDELDQDDEPGLKEADFDASPESKLDVPIIAIDQGLFDSLSLPGSTFSQEDLVRAIQQAAQKAQGHTHSGATVSLDARKKTESSSGRYIGLTGPRRSQKTGDLEDDNFDQQGDKKDDRIIPLITMDQSILDSLFLPSKNLKEKDLVLAIQQAARAALKHEETDSSSKAKITHELTVEDKGEKQVQGGEVSTPEEGDIPLIALEKSQFDSLSLPGSTFNQHDLALAIQKATQAALHLKSSDGGKKESSVNLGSNFSSRIKEENEIANKGQFNSDPGSTSVFIKLSDNKAFEEQREEFKQSNTVSEGEVPVIAIEKEAFDSISLPGSAYTESDLLAAIQEATTGALEPNQPLSDLSQISEIDRPKDKIAEKNANVLSKFQGENNGEITVAEINQSAFGSPFRPKTTLQHDLSGAIQETTLPVLSRGGVSSSSGSSASRNGETASQVTLSQKDSSSSLLGLISPEENSISEGNIPIVVLQRTVFDALPAQGKIELLSALQQASQVAIASGAEATGGVGENTKIKTDKEKASSSSFSSSSSSSPSFGSRTSSDSGAVITHLQGNAASDRIIPVVALEKTTFNSMDAKEKSQLISSIQEAAKTIFNQKSSSSTIQRGSKFNSNIGFSSGSESPERGIPVLALNKELFDSMPIQEKNELLSEIQQATQTTIGSSSLLPTLESNSGGEIISPSSISSTVGASKSGLESSSSAISLPENLISGNGVPIIALDQVVFNSMSLEQKNKLLATIKKATELALDHPQSPSKSPSKVKEIFSGGSNSAAINFEKKTISGPAIPVVAVDEVLFNSMSAQEKGNLVAAIQQATLKTVTGSKSTIATGSAISSSSTDSVQGTSLLGESKGIKGTQLDANPTQNFSNHPQITTAEVDLSNSVNPERDHIDFGQGVLEAFEQLNKVAHIKEISNSQTKVDEGLLESISPQSTPITQSNTESAGHVLEQTHPTKSKQIFEDLGLGLQTVDVPLSRKNNLNSNTLSSFTNSVSEFKEMHNKMVDPVS